MSRLAKITAAHTVLKEELRRVLGNDLDPVVQNHTIKSMREAKDFVKHINQKQLVAEHPDALSNLPEWHAALTTYLARSPQTRIMVWDALQTVYLGMQHADTVVKLQMRIKRQRESGRAPILELSDYLRVGTLMTNASTNASTSVPSLPSELVAGMGPIGILAQQYYPSLVQCLPPSSPFRDIPALLKDVPQDFWGNTLDGIYKDLANIGLFGMASEYGLSHEDVIDLRDPVIAIGQAILEERNNMSRPVGEVDVGDLREEIDRGVEAFKSKILNMPEVTKILTVVATKGRSK